MKTKEVPHRKFKRGQMVKVLWRDNWYQGKYYGWANFEKRHVVKFPVQGFHGIHFQPLFVRDYFAGQPYIVPIPGTEATP